VSDKTEISWADSTWSPWEGCTRVSEAKNGGGGCDNCYAERMNRWLHGGENWGPGAPRRIYSEAHWGKPIKWQRDAPKFHTLHGRDRRVFPSVCDPFDKEAPALQRTRLWQTIRLTPALTWLLLTKRIGNAKSMLPADWGDGYPNVWLGATVVNQAEADRDIPKLLQVPARVRFLSIEPMLGDIRLGSFLQRSQSAAFAAGRVTADMPEWTRFGSTAIDWVIAGGESGPHARPMHPEWARSLRDECAAAGVPFHFKQWGEWTPGENVERVRGTVDTAFLHDDVWHVYPLNLATDHGHIDDQPDLYRIGKKAAGRLLDGVEHNGFPHAPLP
jgi:protein gp37